MNRQTVSLGKRIAFIHHSRAAESSADIGAGVEAAAEILGCELLTYDPAFDQERRRKCVIEAIESGPDLIIAAVVAPALLPDLFAEIASREIPWIEVGARQEPWPGLTCQVVPDERALTALLDAWLFETLAQRLGQGVGAELAAWVAPALGPGLVARDQRRSEDLAANPHVREVYTHEIELGDLANDIRASTINAMGRYPQIRALWQTCEPCVATQAQSLDELGLVGNERPVIAGFYSNRVTRQLTASGRVDGLVQVDMRVQGLIAMDLAVQHWLRDVPWPTTDVSPMTAYEVEIGQPWMITPETVGDDPSRLVTPGPDPIAFFGERWRTEYIG